MKKKAADRKQILVRVSQQLGEGPASGDPLQAAFAEVVNLIEEARRRASKAVDTELVGLY